MATFVNKLTVHGDHETFLAVRNRITAYMATQPGYLGHQHLRRLGEGHVYLEIAVWQDAAAHRAAFGTPGFQQLLAELKPLVTAEPAMYEPVDAQDQARPEAAGVR
ncbi:antibiotic biosynthesis monooxygenase family protein [Streptomyces sp. NPDC005408]|uniref:antibiotic biosynthesis monooxygenase family protein n=1 Tax=Streptomyces sp. NPDC005408 TaxID=3155341 RepID=UPI0033B065B6